ncbi:MAG: signal peptidase I [Gammaproteobacteria bacterium]|nr:MAG: signal peptidase I [Gammaproteobacteria bacterium]
MNFDFQAILLILTVLTGVIWLLDRLFFARNRVEFENTTGKPLKTPVIVDYSRSFFPVLLIVLILRSFLVEPFRIPSGSMEPTLYPGDFILVNKYSYGVHLPLSGTEIVKVGEPQRGEVIVFRYPKDPSLDYIKRVVGLPGDEIDMIGQKLWVNGKPIAQKRNGPYDGQDHRLKEHGATVFEESLGTHLHRIVVMYKDGILRGRAFHVTVPDGHYFVMGDNRDNSNDSRFWGFVPRENLVGRAFMIWMSWNTEEKNIQWSRIGSSIE